jgi:hypothetical protein
VNGFTLGEQLGSAGAITGMLSQVFDPATLTSMSSHLEGAATGKIATIIAAAVAVVKKTEASVLAIAQAASQTIRTMSENYNPNVRADIIAAVTTGLGTAAALFPGILTRVAGAVDFGETEAIAGNLPAGAAGVINFIKNVSGAPVTSIFEL